MQGQDNINTSQCNIHVCGIASSTLRLQQTRSEINQHLLDTAKNIINSQRLDLLNLHSIGILYILIHRNYNHTQIVFQ